MADLRDAALSHLIRAAPPPPPPLAHIPPRSPRHASWGAWAEQLVVDDELHTLMLDQRVDYTRKKLQRQAQAVRD